MGVEFIFDLKDKVSAGMERMAAGFSTMRTKASSVASEIMKMKQSSDTLSNSLTSLRSKGENLKIASDAGTSTTKVRELNGELQKLERQIHKTETAGSGGGLRRWIGDAASSLPGGAFLTNPITMGVAGAGYITSLGIEYERISVSMEVLLGSKAKADKMIDDVKKYAMVTPYETIPLNDNIKMMLGFGISQEKVLGNMKMLGDVAMGDQNKLNSLTLAFSQMSSAGKLMGQDLLQFVNAGFNPLSELSKMTGKSMAVLRKEMENGAISSQMVVKAFEHATSKGGLFYGMTERMGQTVGGRLSTLIDNLKENLLILFELIGPVVSFAIDGLIKVMNGLKPVLSTIVTGFKWLFKELKDGNPVLWIGIAAITTYTIVANAAAIVGGIVALATKTWTAAQWLLNAALTMNPIGLVIAAIVALIATIAYVVYKTDGWGKTWQNIMTYMKLQMNLFVLGIKMDWLRIEDFFMRGIEAIERGWYKLKSLWDKKGAPEGLARLESDRNKRAEELTNDYVKAVTMNRQARGMTVFELKWNKDKKLSDITGGIKNQLGMPTDDATKNDKTNNAENATAVATGGQRSTSINITLGKFFENMVFNGGFKENANDIERQMQEAFMRLLFAAQSAA